MLGLSIQTLTFSLNTLPKMKTIDFKERTHLVGEKQEEYETLPAHIDTSSPERPFTYCVELDATELAQVNNTKRIWLSQLTFGHAFQPIRLSILKPEEVGPDTTPVRALTGVELIAQERNEQRDAHGWDEAHDDEHVRGELRHVATYLLTGDVNYLPEHFGFSLKPKTGIEALKVSGALIAAEIDRLQRIELLTNTEED